MILLSPGFFLMLAVAGFGMWQARSAIATLKRETNQLTEEEGNELQKLMAAKTRDAELPFKYRAIIAAQKKVARVHIFTVIGLIASMFAVVFLGWKLGLAGKDAVQ